MGFLSSCSWRLCHSFNYPLILFLRKAALTCLIFRTKCCLGLGGELITTNFHLMFDIHNTNPFLTVWRRENVTVENLLLWNVLKGLHACYLRWENILRSLISCVMWLMSAFVGCFHIPPFNNRSILSFCFLEKDELFLLNFIYMAISCCQKANGLVADSYTRITC